MVSWIFDIPNSTVSRYSVTWTYLLYFSLGKIVIWPSQIQMLDTMPETFKTTYPSTQCINDCTEIFSQRPSSLSSQKAMYSNYMDHLMYKGFLGTAPAGPIIFISKLYEGSISDKKIVKRSSILNKIPGMTMIQS